MVNFEVEKLRQIVMGIAEQSKFSKLVDITFSRGSQKGDGYMAEMVRIHVVDRKTQEELYLIAKISMKDEKIRQLMPIAESFVREIQAYTKIFPAFRNLQLEAKIKKPFNVLANHYSFSMAQNEEYIILEDLKKSGFEMYNSKKLLDHEHINHIFVKYGQFHAISFAIKILQPQIFQELKNGLRFTFYDSMNKPTVSNFFLSTWNFIKIAVKEEGYKYELLDEYAENCLVMMQMMCNHAEEKFSTILHGDCWVNNFMFKYKVEHQEKKLEEMKILDWQACHVGSPVFDLSYLLYSSASKAVLDNLQSYLNIYHDSLSNFLSHLGFDANSIYTFEELKRQWKNYCHFGVIMSGVIWKVRSIQENLVVDHLDSSSNGDTIYIDEISVAECDKKYLVENIKNIFDHLNDIINEEI